MKMPAILLFTLLLAAAVVYGAIKNNTTPTSLGVNDGKLAELPASPNAVSSQTSDVSRKVEPLPFRGDLAETRRALLAVFHAQEAELITDSPEYIHAVFRTPIIPFCDDVELFFDAPNRLVHYRSASRVGYSDFGVNRKRFELIRQLYLQAPRG